MPRDGREFFTALQQKQCTRAPRGTYGLQRGDIEGVGLTRAGCVDTCANWSVRLCVGCSKLICCPVYPKFLSARTKLELKSAVRARRRLCDALPRFGVKVVGANVGWHQGGPGRLPSDDLLFVEGNGTPIQRV